MTKKREPREFYVLISQRGTFAEDFNWGCHGRAGVYKRDRKKQVGDEVIKVREVLPRKKKVK